LVLLITYFKVILQFFTPPHRYRGIITSLPTNPFFSLHFVLLTSNIKKYPKVLLNVLNLYRPLRGSFLSNLALNVRKSHINQAKFLQAIFASLSSRKRSIFHLTYFLDRRTHLRQKSLLNLLHYQSLRLTSKIFKPNRGTRTTFLSNPLIFCSVFLRTSNIENCP